MAGSTLTGGLGFGGRLVTRALVGPGAGVAPGPSRVLTRGLGFGGSILASGLGAAATSTADDGPLPADLDAAIVARFAADATLAALATAIYADRAADSATLPYVVLRVGGGSPAFASDTSTWLDQRVKFECFARTTEAAGRIARAVLAAFGTGPVDGVSLSYASGVTAPLATTGNVEVAERARGRDNARVCRATVEYSARCRLGRPS